MEISYDEDADVLYVTLEDAERTDTEHRDDDILVRKNADTGEIVGFTIIDFSEREEGIDLQVDNEVSA